MQISVGFIIVNLIGLFSFLYGGYFSSFSNNIQPAVVNQAGLNGITSLTIELHNSVGEVGISSYTSQNNFLFAGFLQTISYPNRITSLSATQGLNIGEIKLFWIAPGADGTVGTCASYDIRYSTDPAQSPALSEEKFQQCRSVSEFSPIPQPQPYGSFQTITITGLMPGVTYYFAIKARDDKFSWSFLSNGATSWAATVANTPPNPPSDLAQYSLSWENIPWDTWTNKQQFYAAFTLSDPDSDNTLQYNIQFSSYSDYSYLFINSTYPHTATLPQGATYFLTPLLQEGTWWWRVKAVDNFYSSSDYTLANSGNPAIKIDISAPTGHGIVSVESYISSCSVSIALAEDKLSGLHTEPYSIIYSTSSSFEVSISSVTDWFSGLSKEIYSLVPNTTYYFKVRARDNVGNVSGWSEIFLKSTLCNYPAGVGWYAVWSSSLTISWSFEENPSNPDNTVYIAQVSTSSNFTGALYSSQTIRQAGKATIEGLSWNTIYYGRVIAKNHSGYDTISTISYSTKTTMPKLPPQQPQNLGQKRSDNGVFIEWNSWINNLTPVLTFYLSDPNTDEQVKFRIQVSTEPSFSSNIIDYTSELLLQGYKEYTLSGLFRQQYLLVACKNYR